MQTQIKKFNTNLKFLSRENLAMKSMKSKCNSHCKKAKNTIYFKKCTSKNSSNNKQFWNLVNCF